MKKLLSVILAVIVVAMSVPVVQISAEGAEDYTYETDDGWAAEEHTHNEMYLEERAPTCTEDGWTAEVICADCGVVLREKEIIPAFGHNFDGGVCSYCGESNGESVEHTHNEVIRPGYAPTCTTEGLTDTVFCADCGVIISDAQILPALGHEYSENGVCIRCGEGGDVHVHTEELIPQEDPTCTEPGWTEWIICHECGEQLTHSSEIAPLGHSYVDGYCERCYEEEPSGSEDFVYEIIDGEVTITGAYSATTSVTVPEYIEGYPVTTIGDYAFSWFEGTYEFCLPGSIKSIGDYAFAHTSVQHMVLPENLTDLGEGAFYSCSNLMSVVIPEGVQFIMPGTFEGCGYLSEVTLSNGLIAIHRNAFTKCYSLVSIDIPYTISKIDGQAFSECYDLREVNIAEGNDIYYSAGSAIMMYNDGRLVVGIGGQPIPDDGSVKIVGSGSYYKSYLSRSLVIPDGVQYIDAYAFFECGNVFELTLPESIIRIGDSAFAGTSVRTVYYNGTREQWENVEIGYDNDVFAEAEVIFADGSTTGCAHENVFTLGGYAPTCTEYGVTEGLMCNDCGKVVQYQDSIPPLGHSYVDGYCERCGEQESGVCEHIETIIPGREPTCTESGMTEGVCCSVCGELLSVPMEIPPLGHEETVTPMQAPTCTMDGWTDSVFCFVCYTYLIYPDVIPATGHNEVVLPDLMPTCTEDGMTGGVQCDTCGEILVYPAVIGALGHDFVDGYCQVCGENESGGEAHIHTEVYLPSVEPTCTENGWTDGIVCGECGFVIVEQTILPAYGHSEELIGGYEPTCTESGMMDFLKCYNCGEMLSEIMEIPPLGHSFVDGYCTRCGEQKGEEECNHVETIIPGKRPTCTEEGLSEGLFCSLCGLVFWEQQIVPPEGHCEEWVYGWEPSCWDDGMTDGIYCERCGEWLVEQTIITSTGHSFQYFEGVEPTCTEDGYTSYSRCSVCGFEEMSQTFLPAYGHDEVWTYGYDATCTMEGLTEGCYCERCGETIVEQYVTPMLPHTEIWEGGWEPTCTEPGRTEGCYCSMCGEVLLTAYDIPAKGHTEEIVPMVPPTCTEEGLSDGKYCSVCYETLVIQEIIPALGHQEEWLYGHEATCTEEGLTDGKWCVNCGETTQWQEYTPPLGHEFVDGYCTRCGEQDSSGHVHEIEIMPGVAPTCTDYGSTEGQRCLTCGEVLVRQEYIEPIGHNFVDGACTNCGVLDSDSTDVSYEIVDGGAIITDSNYDAKEIIVPDMLGGYPVVAVGTYSFSNRMNLINVVLPETVTVIWDYAFSFSEINTIYLPKSLTTIAEGAFSDCLSLKTVYFSGTAEEFAQIRIGTNNDALLKAEIVYMGGGDESHVHTEAILEGYRPTCTEDGMTEGIICSECGEIIRSQAVIPAMGHREEIIPSVAPTCVDSGLTDGLICSVCGEILAEQAYIEALGHEVVNGVCTRCDYTEVEVPVVDYVVEGVLTNGGKQLDVTISVKGNIYNIWSSIMYLDFNKNALVPIVDSFEIGDTWGSVNCMADVSVIPVSSQFEWARNCVYVEFVSNDVYKGMPYSDGVIVKLSFEVLNAEEDFNLNYALWSDKAEYEPVASNHLVLIDGEPVVADVNVIYSIEEDYTHTHTEVIVPGYAPTCTEPGLTDGISCEECGEVILEQTAIAPVNHNYVDGKCSYCGLVLDTEKFLLNVTSEMIDGKLYVYYDINNNPGIWSIMADLSFNAEALELVGIYNGVVFTGGSYSESPVTDGTHRYFAALESIENCYENGRLVTYVFDILDSTKSFDIAVNIDPENVFNCDFENQEITIVNEANKEIETPDEPEVSIGDINGDNSVNTQDLFRVKLIMQTIVEPTDAERAAADVNGDGLVNAADIFALSYRILYGEWV